MKLAESLQERADLLNNSNFSHLQGITHIENSIFQPIKKA